MGSVMVAPTPTAGPLMAPITGLVHWKMRRVRRPPSSRWGRRGPPPPPVAGLPASTSKLSPPLWRSAPAQKPRPRPVTTTTRTSGSASASSKAAHSSRCIGTVKAFSRSGRSRVIVRTRSATSVAMVV